MHILVLWLVLGSILGEFATHVRDYIDFDAGRYERLAISIARTHSLVPRVNGVYIHNFSQLYPLMIAPFFAHGLVPADLENANIAGAYVMSSACVPAFLLTRRVTRLGWAPYVVAVLSVCMPWIVTSLAMMTEVVAYPAFTWALFAAVVAISAPSKKHDLLALLALAVAYAARPSLLMLAIVLPAALVAFELGRASAGNFRDRVVTAGRSLVGGHVILAIAFAAAGVAALVLYAQDRLSSVLGVYSVYADTTHLRYGALPRSLVEHLATFSLGVGVVPCVIALAWIGANVLRPSRRPEAHAFACLGAAATVVFFVQATNFDLALDAYVHDRFLMYFVPVVLIGTVLAVTDERKPRWSLAVPLGLIVAGFVFGDIPRVTWGQFVWLDIDTPVATVYRVLASHLGGLTATRGVLVGLAVAGTALFLLAGRTLRPRRVTAGVLAFCAIAMVVVTTLVFRQAFTPLDLNLRHITAKTHGTFDWIDEAVGPDGNVTAISYPISSDWFVNQQRWVDFEFFNKSIQRLGRVAGSDPFDYVGIWFPKLDLHLDDSTGAVLESPTRWVVGSEKETRFRVAGPAKLAQQGAVLIDAGRDWRLAWRTFGLYDDGWTMPGVPARMRVYPARGQRTPELRTATFVLRGPPKGAPRHVRLTTPGHVTRAVVGQEDVTEFVPVCVPTRGYAEIRLDVDGSSAITGDLATLQDSLRPRRGGVFIASLSEADEVGGACTA